MGVAHSTNRQIMRNILLEEMNIVVFGNDDNAFIKGKYTAPFGCDVMLGGEG